MCGFAGILTRRPTARDALSAAALRMARTLGHRGPDDEGEWADERHGIALGFRRLAIVDLSEQGHQPMRSHSGRYMVVFNGEVYNFRQLGRELEGAGIQFRGHSDTEVMLAAFDRWGIEQAVRRFVGMFAIAVWDVERKALTLIRDHMGIKPLFIHHQSGLLTFGSELKALHAGPAFDRTLDPESVRLYLNYLYVPAPRSIFRGTTKLLPGHLVTITDTTQNLPDPTPYWALSEVARRGINDPFRGSEEEAIEALTKTLEEAVTLQMHADVPLGALLSGGIDSSTVVALMQAASSRPIKTFTVAFDVAEHNEASHAKRVSAYLGTDHTEVRVDGHVALTVVPRLAEMYDEPLADPSQIPTFLVSEVARRSVTVALSGDGGDELFAGYNRYLYGARVLPRMNAVPHALRRFAARVLGAPGAGRWAGAYSRIEGLLPSPLRHRLPDEKIDKMVALMRARSQGEMYRSLMSAWRRPATWIDPTGARDQLVDAIDALWPTSLVDRMMLADQLHYLPDDLLAKVDRASMAVSLEVRVPILDHRVVELSWRMPRQLLIGAGAGKRLLRQVAYRRIPRTLLDRPKMGFTVPIAAWLDGPLQEWSRDMVRGLEEWLISGSARAGQSVDPARSPLALWALALLGDWINRWHADASSAAAAALES